jgi:hypothetical protein
MMTLLYLPLIALTALRHMAYLITLGKNHHWIGPMKFNLFVLPFTLIFNFFMALPDKILNENSPQIKERRILSAKN